MYFTLHTSDISNPSLAGLFMWSVSGKILTRTVGSRSQTVSSRGGVEVYQRAPPADFTSDPIISYCEAFSIFRWHRRYELSFKGGAPGGRIGYTLTRETLTYPVAQTSELAASLICQQQFPVTPELPRAYTQINTHAYYEMMVSDLAD